MVSFAQILVVEREPQTALEVALARLDQSWSVLADLQIGPKDEIAAEYVALHPARGIALIDLASNTRNDPTDCLRRLLNRHDFTARFPGVLPVVRLIAEATDAATIADRLEAAFAQAPAITIAKSGWVNAVSNILIGRVRGARLPARVMTERPAHLAQRHQNTTSALDLDAWKYAPGKRPNDRPGHETVEPEMPRHPASRARPPGGFIEEPELSPGGPRRETPWERRAITPALQPPRSAFALLLGVIAGGMIAGGAVWLALDSGVGDRFAGPAGVVRVALEPPPVASIASQPAPATSTGVPPSVGPLPVASPALEVEQTPTIDSAPLVAATPTIPTVEAEVVSAPNAEPPMQPRAPARLPDREPLQAQAVPQQATRHASPDERELAQPASAGSSVSLAESSDSPAAPPPATTLLPDFEPPALAGPPLETASPAASPPASSEPAIVERPFGRAAHLAARPAEKSAASAQRPMRMSEPRSKSAPTKQALLEAPKPKRYDGQPVDAHQPTPSEAAMNPRAPAMASAMPNMHAPTSLLSRPVIAEDLPVVSCRAYTSTHNLLGQLGNVRGVACREPEGQWTIVQETLN